MSGSKDPAEQGQLTIFASGPDDVRSCLDPLFDALGQRTIWVGPVGAGSRLKLVANAWLALSAEAINTSVALARRLGLEAESVVDALRGSPLVSQWQAAKLQRIAQGDFSVQFALSLALKDVHLALEAAGDDSFRGLPAWPTNGRKSSSTGLATATSRSSPGHSSMTEESPHPDRTCNLGRRPAGGMRTAILGSDFRGSRDIEFSVRALDYDDFE